MAEKETGWRELDHHPVYLEGWKKFKGGFGNAKVNPDGSITTERGVTIYPHGLQKPVTGYHGSPNQFKQFHVHDGLDENKFGPGVYLTPDREGATNFVTNAAQPGTPFHLYKVQASVTKLLDADARLPDQQFDAINESAKALGHQGLPESFRGGQGRSLYRLLVTRNHYDNSVANRILARAGFDGVKEQGEFVVFDPKKLVIAGVKTFTHKG